jgi:iron complex transport system permease protein
MRTYALLFLLLVLALVFATCAGHTWTSPGAVIESLIDRQTLSARLLLEWRVPRVLCAALVGILLGLSGAIFQGVFRNPLAEPWLLGSSGGAAVGATIALLVPLALPMSVSLPLFSFVGAMAAIFLVLGVSRIAGALDTTTLLLAGVAISAILSAIRSFLMMALANESISLQAVLSWLLGGVQTPAWNTLALAFGAAICCFVAALSLARGLDLLGLGETMAMAFGLSPRRFSVVALTVGSAIVAAAVALGGVVGFVGLAAPHLARWLCGSAHRKLLPAAGLIGAIVVVVADALSRSLLPPGEIPLGLITALAGGPFFIVLLSRKARQG